MADGVQGRSGTPPPAVAAAPYRPTEAERAYSCRKLTGLVQVKLLQLADTDTRPRPSEAAMATRGLVAPVLGASEQVVDPATVWSRERARADAYNRLLAEKGCKTFDIPAELAKVGRRDGLPPLPVPSTPPTRR